MLRWILVLPTAILAFLVSDTIIPLVFNLLIYVGQWIRLAPLFEVLISPPPGDYIVVFFTYFTALISGAYVAPKRKILTAFIISFLFLAMRVGMTVSVLSGRTDFTEDTPTEFIVGTLVAFVGAISGFFCVKEVWGEKPMDHGEGY